MKTQSHALSQGWRRHLWLALLVAASVAFSLSLACAVPLAAFAAAASLTLSRRDAVLLVGAVWLANQIVGFAVLGYPWTANCLAWGVALGVVALLSTLAARGVASSLDGTGPAVGPIAAFLAAFIVYEGALFIVAAALLGGTEDFTPAIAGRIFAINAVAMAGLLLVSRLAVAVGLVAAPRFGLSPMGRRHA